MKLGMKQSYLIATTSCVLFAIDVDAFSISSTPVSRVNMMSTQKMNYRLDSSTTSRVVQTRLNQTPEGSANDDDEIERLRSMAAKLRAEASALEAEKAQQLAEAAEKAFRSFDTNKDGEISVAELKEGLEKEFKTELSDKRVQELMKEFDASGDGALQLDEFVGIDIFRNKLELLAQEEKRLAQEAAEKAKREEMEAALAIAKVEILNEKDPTVSDKILSVLPYFFPLFDGLQWGRFLLGAEGAESNPFVLGLALLYAFYRSIPLSGFLSFLVLSFLGGNPSINRLIRYNMQQAIFLDIALFFPGLIGGLFGLVGLRLPGIFNQIGSDVIFVTLLATIGYCAVSSLLGIAPNKIPLISQAVEDRMPSVDSFDLDTEGNIIFRPREEEESKDEKKDDGDKK